MPENFENEIFKSDFPLEGPHLISASAGTGKTHQLQNIYARLILEKGFRVPEILVMTFTKAATRELKERICTVLKDLKRRCAVPPLPCAGKTEESRADRLIACAGAKGLDRKLLSGRVELALLEFDNAAISTIHGFCQRALARYAFETGFSFGAEIQDQQKGAAFRRLSGDWWLCAAPEEKENGTLNTLRDYCRVLSAKSSWDFEAEEKDPLLRQAKDLISVYENERQNRENMTYDDLLRALCDALNGPKGEMLAEKLRQEYRAALIDEFQDTDPVQYEIFRKIFMGQGEHPLFFVGDPKQAIYSFRGGDIFTYRRAVAELPETVKYELTGNFRTSAGLMRAINAIFRDMEEEFTFGTPDIPYRTEIVAKGEHPQLRERGIADPAPFHWISVEPPLGREELYEVLADEILRTLYYTTLAGENGVERRISPGDIAVLTATHDNARAIGGLLRKRAIPCVLEETGSIFARGGMEKGTRDPGSAMALDFYALLNAVIHDGEKELLRRALLTPFFPFSPADLLAMTEERFAEWTGKFRELNRLWHHSGFGSFLARAEESGRVGEITLRERLAARGDGGRSLSDYEAMLRASVCAMAETGNRPENLLSWWEERLANIAEEEELFQREAENDSDAVRVMTMHAAKGLQFPVVFVPDTAFPPGRKPYSYHGKGGHLFFSSQKTDPRIDQENQDEKMRLLYVALTRAEEKCVLLSPARFSPLLRKLFDRAVAHGAGAEAPGSPILYRKISSLEFQNGYWQREIPEFRLAPQTPRLFDLLPLKGSYSSLQSAGPGENGEEKDRDREKNELFFAEDDPAAQKEPVFQIRSGAAAGNCWHDILEKIPFDADEGSLRMRVDRSLREYGFSPDDPLCPSGTVLSVSAEMIRKTLDFPLQAPDGTVFTLKEIPWSRRTSEQEFDFSSSRAVPTTAALAEIIARHWKNLPDKQDFLAAMQAWDRPVPRGFFTGFIDLLFRQGDFYYIVDWKSNSLKEERARRFALNVPGDDPFGFDREGIRREMASHWYFFQYLFYSVVLHRVLKQYMGGNYRWEKHFGGIRYLFLRGIAAASREPFFADRPAPELLDELENALGLEAL